jgi:Xaa-Pro aminopeptidase
LEKEIYTRLLKGILAIEATSFPEGTTGTSLETTDAGYQIDSIIRQHLWAGGFDYPGVATGHGVTHGLGVIEGGASISQMKMADQTGLREGMIMTIGLSVPPPLTVEPGVYLPSILGIRLENVYVVTASAIPQYTLLHPTLVRQRKFLRLETLDYIPFQRKMIMDHLITSMEWEMLRVYHSNCIERISGQCVTDAGRGWVQRESRAWLQ